MNLLGKIFTVLILLTSVVLMVVAMFVYATHRNWQTAYNTLNAKFTGGAGRERQCRGEVPRPDQPAEERATRRRSRRRASSRPSANVIVSQNQAIQKEVDQLRQASTQNEHRSVKATEENNNRLTEEVTGLRDSIRVAQQARDEAFHTTLKATSELHSVGGQLQQVQERNTQIVAQLADVTAKATEGGVEPRKASSFPAFAARSATPAATDGGQLIEITIGADDGVRPGQTVEVFRGERYLGRAEILKADPDRAVGRIIREFQQGQIQEDDDVATKLRVG